MIVGIPERVAPLALVIPPKPLDLAASVLHYLADLLALRRTQMNVPIEPFDEVSAGHPQETKPVRQRAKRKADQQAGNNRNQDCPEIRPIRQSRYSSV
jgi:hypothetical protein